MMLPWVAAILLGTGAGMPAAWGDGFVGDVKCGNPTCHGAALPANEAAKKDWKPWKSARTQWMNRNIDRHSRAYATLTSDASQAIAGSMGITATASEKCLRCHAPEATAAPGSSWKRSDGVTCEHCHGAAEAWLKPHVEKDWRQKTAQYQGLGFYDNDDFRLRAEKCAGCHLDIDHEIVAGGHPPLQFELVAYAQIMKHWDDQDERPAGAFSVDPTLWSVGQLVGLRGTMEMIRDRAGNDDYQGLGKFHGFTDANCYTCHHKLVEDAARQAGGHEAMAEAIAAALFPDKKGQIESQWGAVKAGVAAGPGQAQQAATALAETAKAMEAAVAQRGVDQAATRAILRQITASAERYKRVERFGHSRPQGKNTLQLTNPELPWWYTTGAPEQSILAVLSLCEPAAPGKCTGPTGIDAELRQVLSATNRFDYKPEAFSAGMSAINRKLFR